MVVCTQPLACAFCGVLVLTRGRGVLGVRDEGVGGILTSAAGVARDRFGSAG